jgi:hypothetical protein
LKSYSAFLLLRNGRSGRPLSAIIHNHFRKFITRWARRLTAATSDRRAVPHFCHRRQIELLHSRPGADDEAGSMRACLSPARTRLRSPRRGQSIGGRHLTSRSAPNRSLCADAAAGAAVSIPVASVRILASVICKSSPRLAARPPLNVRRARGVLRARWASESSPYRSCCPTR